MSGVVQGDWDRVTLRLFRGIARLFTDLHASHWTTNCNRASTVASRARDADIQFHLIVDPSLWPWQNVFRPLQTRVRGSLIAQKGSTPLVKRREGSRNGLKSQSDQEISLSSPSYRIPLHPPYLLPPAVRLPNVPPHSTPDLYPSGRLLRPWDPS